MQYLENSVVALRAAHYVLAHQRLQAKFYLFPMIHVGSASFYAQVGSRLAVCDDILFEGVRSMRGRILTLSYRLLTRRKRLGPVLQSAALPLRKVGPRLICGDVSSDEFEVTGAASLGTRVSWSWCALQCSGPINTSLRRESPSANA
jgi:hypothetical protein